MVAVMNMYKIKQLLPLLLLFPLLIIILLLCCMQRTATVSFCRYPAQTLIIDAGHGGEDGGAVAVSGTPESALNLVIAKKMDQLCGLYGVQTKMVRTEDVSLADPEADTLRKKKHSDLLNRVELVNNTQQGVLISIHQNNYSNRSSHGAQVFYHDDIQSQQWAVQLQEMLRQNLDPDNSRQATRIPETVYLMNHISCRAVLVECGFLSNKEEDQLLESDHYQTKIAATLAASYLQLNAQGELGE